MMSLHLHTVLSWKPKQLVNWNSKIFPSTSVEYLPDTPLTDEQLCASRIISLGGRVGICTSLKQFLKIRDSSLRSFESIGSRVKLFPLRSSTSSEDKQERLPGKLRSKLHSRFLQFFISKRETLARTLIVQGNALMAVPSKQR
ncbi:hypothetical protein D5086_033508 [Populus alba]|uniref:Uncharacterized protein n=1 Tax=Populus alba TaxID=43335 RepID=A0ACC4AHX0_POPAL